MVSTAPTYQQVHAILWEEIRRAAKKAEAKGQPLAGRVLQSDEWKLDDGTLVGWGRKPADQDVHGFQGIHRRYVLVILDEACGVPTQLWTAVEAITTNRDCRILAIGNPDDPATEFAKVCKPGSGWSTIRISAFDTPNFTDEPVPEALRPMLLDPEWVEDKQRRWGEESPRYVSKVLGDFPDIGENVLISPSLIAAAQARTLDPGPDTIMGVDVARFGSDRTVFGVRRGGWARVVAEYSKLATTETTGRLIDTIRTERPDEVRIDGVGVGGGVVDQLRERALLEINGQLDDGDSPVLGGVEIIDMQAGAAATDPEHFLNARAEWYWALRERFEQGDMDIDEHDDDLAAQLGSIRYKYTARGQVVIESKADMKKRGLPSPDRADQLMLTAGHVLVDDGDVYEDADAVEYGISQY